MSTPALSLSQPVAYLCSKWSWAVPSYPRKASSTPALVVTRRFKCTNKPFSGMATMGLPWQRWKQNTSNAFWRPFSVIQYDWCCCPLSSTPSRSAIFFHHSSLLLHSFFPPSGQLSGRTITLMMSEESTNPPSRRFVTQHKPSKYGRFVTTNQTSH